MNLNLRYNRLNKMLTKVREQKMELSQKIGAEAITPLRDRKQSQLSAWQAEYNALDEKEWVLSCKLQEAEVDYRLGRLGL